MRYHVTLLAALVTVLFATQVSASKLLQRHIRSPPPGQTMEKFSKTCEYCGEVFGPELTYKCLFDPTFGTYNKCILGLSRR